jgi:hypothetical protein
LVPGLAALQQNRKLARIYSLAHRDNILFRHATSKQVYYSTVIVEAAAKARMRFKVQ